MKQLLTCRTGHEWYGLPLHNVQEVLPMMALRAVPDSNVIGMLLLRDRMLPVLDLRQHLGLSTTELHVGTLILAINVGDTSFGLIVEEVDRIITVEQGTEQTHAHGQRVILQSHVDNENMVFELNLDVLSKQGSQDVKSETTG